MQRLQQVVSRATNKLESSLTEEQWRLYLEVEAATNALSSEQQLRWLGHGQTSDSP